MFDKTTVNNSSPKEVFHNTTITEKKAPTDESVRIYQEMLDKANENFVWAFKLYDNDFKLLLVAFRPAIQSLWYKVFVRYSLNGKTFSDEYELDPIDSKLDQAKWLCEKIVKDVALRIFSENFKHQLSDLLAKHIR